MRNVNYKEKGITLIALVITIIILLILAGVTLTTALGQNGLFERAKYAGEKYKESEADEAEKLGEVEKEIDKIIDGGNQQKPLVSTVTDTSHTDNKKVQDSLGNPVVIPGGFKFAGNQDDTVQDGIIIEDDEKNQFVWIPVSNIDGDNDKDTPANQKEDDLIKLENNKKVEITLGRYTFVESEQNGKETLVQKGADHSERSDKTKITYRNDDYYEDTDKQGRPNGGIGAKALGEFIDSVKENHGYYIARYEAGEGEDGKPVSKVGKVWNRITQPVASAAAQKMYDGEVNYTSDLVNSYAWDTAIVYIQAMGNENYANANRDTTGNSSLMNTGETGETGDVKCNIYDMAGNVSEWTTEYSTYTFNGSNYPCVTRGGNYFDRNFYTAYRRNYPKTNSGDIIGFRPLLYLK